MPDKVPAVLLVYLEPTPYIEGLIRELRKGFTGSVHTAYLGQNRSQEWDVALDSSVTMILPEGVFAAIRTLWELLDSGQYHALHLAGWGTPPLAAAIVLGWWKRIPVFVESDTHGGRIDTFRRRMLKGVLLPMLLRLPAGFLPGGSRQAAFLRRFGVHPNRIHVAQMTVDVAAIAAFARHFSMEHRQAWRNRHGLSEHDVIILYVGRLEPCKGLVELLDAFRAVSNTCVEPRLLIVGDGSIKNELRLLTESLPSVTFTGRLSGEDVLAAYLASDVFVLPSTFEPWGLVINEAMACGLPVIASNRVGSVDDLVVHGETGLVFDPADRHGLADCLTALANNVGLRVRLGNASREKIGTWTLENEAGNVIQAWRQVL